MSSVDEKNRRLPSTTLEIKTRKTRKNQKLAMCTHSKHLKTLWSAKKWGAMIDGDLEVQHSNTEESVLLLQGVREKTLLFLVTLKASTKSFIISKNTLKQAD